MASKKLDAKADAEKLLPKRVKKEIGVKARAREARQLKAKEMKYARELFAAGVSRGEISRQLKRAPATISKWVKDLPDPNKIAELEETRDPAAGALEKQAAEALEDVEHELIDARTEEEQALLALAQNQNTPADQYQAFIATHGIRLLRDSLKAMKGPRTIRELSELDQIIRRSMGLNPKGTSGNSRQTLQIDINLLNNHKATLPSGVTLDAEEVG